MGAILPFMTRLMVPGSMPSNVEFTSASVVTTTTPTVAYRGAGRPEAAAAEQAMDLFAAEIGMDPVEVRRKNLVPKDAFPYTTAMGTTYDSGDYERALDLAAEASRLRRSRGAAPPARRVTCTSSASAWPCTWR